MRTTLLAAAGFLAVAACSTTSAPGAASTASTDPRAGEAEFRELYKELIETNTTLSVGSCTLASERMKARLVAAGYPESDLHILVNPKPNRPQDGNLVAILPGSNPAKKPILLMAHIDVVEAKREDWVRDPFKLTEEEGFFFARGASDDKAMAAIFTDSMVRFKREGYKPERTIKMMLNCGEESGDEFIGAKYMVENHLDLISAEFALNEGAGGRIDPDTGKYVYNGVQAGEKLYQDFHLEVTNPGGHSSRPVPDNAIYRLGQALAKVEAIQFPIEFNDATRGFFRRMGQITPGQEGQDMRDAADGENATAIRRLMLNPGYNALFKTTCVATQLNAGHAPNALPQRATANVNCRIFPGRTPTEIKQQLEIAINDAQVKVTLNGQAEAPSPPPNLTPEILGPIEKISEQLFPGVPVIPAMATGATDGRFTTPAGIPTYGVSGIFADPNTSGVHGLNERVGVKQLYDGRVFLHLLVKEYAGGK
ncbi:MAG: M20/M25/M40 family metallo-hydrolase [Alphaproteobacteria bacterium]|nr:MAG: M20/M25/M40 family metallo-hydrolase [Alphaproteobacteria bacterium]